MKASGLGARERSGASPNGQRRESTLGQPSSPSSANNSTSDDQIPRSILRPQSSFNRVAPQIGIRRRRRRRYISFNAREEVFLIPTRRQLREEQRRALRRRRLRRQLTISRVRGRSSRSNYKIRKQDSRGRSRGAQRGGRRHLQRRVNRLGRARRRYFRAKRRRRNGRAELAQRQQEETETGTDNEGDDENEETTNQSGGNDNNHPGASDSAVEQAVASKRPTRPVRQRARRQTSSKGLRPRRRTRLRSPPLSEEDNQQLD